MSRPREQPSPPRIVRRTLTARQRQIVEFIQRHYRDQGVAPTQREIADGVMLQQSTVAGHLDRIEKKGWILRVPGLARMLFVAEDAA
ncbi:LexA repressor [Planctomycetes bacterium Pan216]|uniref:LexA repressor n=1 Tax=Kolteria novifilia TaxID=2527975 RepID=A0A518B5F4_9BACT|nr:LexA repressor [Planctomycetes bacterium Pan216]